MQKFLRNESFFSLKDLFKGLINMINKGKKAWSEFKLVEGSAFVKEIKRVKQEVEKKVNAVPPKDYSKSVVKEEKNIIITLTQKFLDKKLEQLRDIKESVTEGK